MYSDLEENGFAILENPFDDEIIADLLEELSNLPINKRNKGVYGVRKLLEVSPKVREFSESSIVREIIEKYLGKAAKIVRAIYFDKTPKANWKVPWHQDLTVSVCQKKETKDWTAWTIKDEVQHVQPPIEILEKMLTLRFHLDNADETNGALKILPKTHKLGRLDATKIQEIKSNVKAFLCKARKGDCLLMKPLVLHSSSSGLSPKNRRIIHIEFSADVLPNGLQFYGT
jgi:ectoine hydroxylase-related dioxygenase (phytanoyl-CoA dioxygenase family)